MTVQIQLSREEAFLVENYTQMYNLSVGDAFKQALFEKIEDKMDCEIAEKAYQEYLNSGMRTTPIEDFWRELDDEV